MCKCNPLIKTMWCGKEECNPTEEDLSKIRNMLDEGDKKIKELHEWIKE